MQKPELNQDGKPGVFEIALIFFTVIVLGALGADTVTTLPAAASQIIHWLDTFACAVFLADVGVRFYRAESKLSFMKWGWIDLLASIPYLPGLRYARMVRVLRVIRLLRGVRLVQRVLELLGRHRAETGAASLAMTGLLLVVFSSISILICEQNGDGNIKTAEDAIWWSISTVTTVGYGDKVPVTTEGRILAMALMVAGVGMFGGLSGLVASLFLGDVGRREYEGGDITARLDAIQRTLNQLARQEASPRPQVISAPGESLTSGSAGHV